MCSVDRKLAKYPQDSKHGNIRFPLPCHVVDLSYVAERQRIIHTAPVGARMRCFSYFGFPHRLHTSYHISACYDWWYMRSGIRLIAPDSVLDNPESQAGER